MGYDAAKKVKGRKIHALVDTEGLPVRVIVHSATTQDRDGAALVLDKIRRRFSWLELIWADSAYNAAQVDAAVAKLPNQHLEIVKRSDDMKGFVVLPRRWVVERTFSWFGRNRRLAKDFENLAETLTAFAAAINGSSRAHSASVRSLGNRSPSRRYVLRCSSVHIPHHPAASNRHDESSFRLQCNDLLGQALSRSKSRER